MTTINGMCSNMMKRQYLNNNTFCVTMYLEYVKNVEYEGMCVCGGCFLFVQYLLLCCMYVSANMRTLACGVEAVAYQVHMWSTYEATEGCQRLTFDIGIQYVINTMTRPETGLLNSGSINLVPMRLQYGRLTAAYPAELTKHQWQQSNVVMAIW